MTITAKDLIRYGVPMVLKTDETGSAWMPLAITKDDRFWRINGKIVAGNLAKAILRNGVKA
jgi:hypothetical protein